MDTYLFILTWIFAGSLGINFIWAVVDMERKGITLDFYDYLKAIFLGFLMGPFTIIILAKFIKNFRGK